MYFEHILRYTYLNTFEVFTIMAEIGMAFYFFFLQYPFSKNPVYVNRLATCKH